MGTRKFRPTTPSRRFMSGSDFEEVSSDFGEVSIDFGEVSKDFGRDFKRF